MYSFSYSFNHVYHFYLLIKDLGDTTRVASHLDQLFYSLTLSLIYYKHLIASTELHLLSHIHILT